MAYVCQCGAAAPSHDALDRHCVAEGHSHGPNPRRDGAPRVYTRGKR